MLECTLFSSIYLYLSLANLLELSDKSNCYEFCSNSILAYMESLYSTEKDVVKLMSVQPNNLIPTS